MPTKSRWHRLKAWSSLIVFYSVQCRGTVGWLNPIFPHKLTIILCWPRADPDHGKENLTWWILPPEALFFFYLSILDMSFWNNITYKVHDVLQRLVCHKLNGFILWWPSAQSEFELKLCCLRRMKGLTGFSCPGTWTGWSPLWHLVPQSHVLLLLGVIAQCTECSAQPRHL